MFIKTIRKSTLTACALLAACAGAGAVLLAWPEAAASGISRGLSICSSIIIPSLFPFLVLAGFLVKSGLSEALGRRLERLDRPCRPSEEQEVIRRAKALLMERDGMTEAQAHRFLQKHSMDHQEKLLRTAQAVLDEEDRD